MWSIFAIILLQIAAFILLLWAFIFFDERLAAWERRTWKRVKCAARWFAKAMTRRLDKIEERINWSTRKIRREICASLLARDGVIVEPVQTERRDLSADFEEVMRLLNE